MDGWLAADIGGTKLACAVYDGRELLPPVIEATEVRKGASGVIDQLERLLSHAAASAALTKLKGIGIACPGPLSPRTGIVLKAPTLGWENVPLVSILEKAFHCPIALENDANAAALGEYLRGAGRGAESMAYMTVSTGVGCGLILNGHILEGAHEAAGELGHLVIRRHGLKCACGNRGCLEQYASGTAVGRRASEILGSHVNAKEAAQIAREGNPALRGLFAQAGEALGQSIAAIMQLVDVERVVIGGSMANALDLMQDAIAKSVHLESYCRLPREQWLFRAALGGNSGLAGAAFLIQNQTEGNSTL